ncbi:MAG: flagellar biosynthesis anti-sigma factor FlgM [Deltaproteobacteria bacterium]|jgi:negative regulator of flagellin synthesis FlgM|nr:flagellar biosynthesis anti-sigma factor FlgM [Deltaproteobacteria bacterium]
MKIDTNTQPLNVKKPGFQNQPDKPTAAQAEESQAVQTGDKVVLSDRSKLIAKAGELVSLAPDVRSEKVADLTARIAAGTYKVDARAVADSIVQKKFDGLL